MSVKHRVFFDVDRNVYIEMLRKSLGLDEVC